ncbi:unnamed protein product, partial [Timema podura]|nr:unnamed protein product [Timema podura]
MFVTDVGHCFVPLNIEAIRLRAAKQFRVFVPLNIEAIRLRAAKQFRVSSAQAPRLLHFHFVLHSCSLPLLCSLSLRQSIVQIPAHLRRIPATLLCSLRRHSHLLERMSLGSKMPGTRCTVSECTNILAKTKSLPETRHIRYHHFPKNCSLRRVGAKNVGKMSNLRPAAIPSLKLGRDKSSEKEENVLQDDGEYVVGKVLKKVNLEKTQEKEQTEEEDSDEFVHEQMEEKGSLIELKNSAIEYLA